MNVSIIIPAYNEEKYLPKTIATLDQYRFWDEVIIVDDGSTDQTSSIALPQNMKMVVHDRNFGKGQAVATGIRNCSGDTLLLLDADLGETVYLAEKLIEPIRLGTADMVIAKFPPAGKSGGFGIVKKIAKFGIKHFTGTEIQEPLSGQRCIRKEITTYLTDFNVGFGFEVAVTIDILRAGYNICEMEIPFRHRELGRTWKGFYHRGKELVHILKTLWLKR